MLRHDYTECEPGDWCFQVDGDGRDRIQLHLPVRPELRMPPYMRMPERTVHSLSVRTDCPPGGVPPSTWSGSPTWWWNGSREAPTLRASIKSNREYVKVDAQGAEGYEKGVIHGFFTDGHWTPCDDDDMTVAT